MNKNINKNERLISEDSQVPAPTATPHLVCTLFFGVYSWLWAAVAIQVLRYLTSSISWGCCREVLCQPFMAEIYSPDEPGNDGKRVLSGEENT